MRIVDTTGQVCPAPLIAAKRALRETPPGGSFILLTDNQVSLNNLKRFLADNKASYTITENEGSWTMTITCKESLNVATEAEAYCEPEIPHFSKGNFIIAFSSDTMGTGDVDLGSLLMKNFIKAIRDLDILPSKMVFYNRGVFLGHNPDFAADLKELSTMGVELYFCGTCLNHYYPGKTMETGTVSNMFEIAQMMASAGSVIKP